MRRRRSTSRRSGGGGKCGSFRFSLSGGSYVSMGHSASCLARPTIDSEPDPPLDCGGVATVRRRGRRAERTARARGIGSALNCSGNQVMRRANRRVRRSAGTLLLGAAGRDLEGATRSSTSPGRHRRQALDAERGRLIEQSHVDRRLLARTLALERESRRPAVGISDAGRTEPATAAGISVAHLRTGIVLSPAGGALPAAAVVQVRARRTLRLRPPMAELDQHRRRGRGDRAPPHGRRHRPGQPHRPGSR